MSADQMPDQNPFKAGEYAGHQTYYTDVVSRISAVQSFDLDQCQAALRVEHLQKTVRTAVERRIRKLEKELAR